MKQDTKRTLILCTLLVFYIILAVSGVYNIGGALILPILGIPFTVHLVKNTYNMSIHALYNVAIWLSIYALTGNIESVLIYIIGISIPAYTISYFYKNKYPLPNIIIYTAIIGACATLIYQIIMKKLGVNYELQYMAYADEIKTVMMPVLINQVIAINGSIDKNIEVQLTQMLINNFELVKQLFAALIVINAFICTLIQVFITHGILRIKDKSLPSFRQLLEFRLSKVILILLAIGILVIGLATDDLDITAILGVNIVVVTYMLAMIVGLLGIIGLVKKASVSKKVKVVSAIFLGAVILCSPTLLILFGFLDTIFNFRKVTLVV